MKYSRPPGQGVPPGGAPDGCSALRPAGRVCDIHAPRTPAETAQGFACKKKDPKLVADAVAMRARRPRPFIPAASAFSLRFISFSYYSLIRQY